MQSSPTLLKFLKPVANAYVNAAGYRKVGLKYDDLLEEETPEMQKVCRSPGCTRTHTDPLPGYWPSDADRELQPRVPHEAREPVLCY